MTEFEKRADTFSGTGVRSIISVLVPKGDGWQEIPGAQSYAMGFPARAFYHRESNLFAISAVETMSDEDKGPEYHISISKVSRNGPRRADRNEAKWVLKQFNLDGAEEDNHVPNGKVRNFWRPVAEPLVGLVCPCQAEEPAMVDDKGDFVWRG